MRLTEKKALELSIELWEWLYHHPSKCKGNWPRWKYNGGDLPTVDLDCFLCEYFNTHGGCARCPLYEHSVNYSRYSNSRNPKTRKRYTKILLDAMREAYEKRR